MIGSSHGLQHGQASRRTLTIDRARIVPTDQDEIATARDRVLLDHNLTVGRQAVPGQVILDHPNVSRRHAAFEIVDGTIVLRDLGGTNGTYVNGERLRGARLLVTGDRIDIGPFQLTFDGTALTRVGRVGNVELLVRDVSYDVRRRLASEAPTRILHDANLRILPSEFVAIIGANGSGKSTLMNIMAGRVLPSEGAVLLNDCDLHANFQALKQDIAFVPQQDVLHEQLTLRQALDFTAQLRLPPDTTVEQRHAAVNDAARSVDLLDRLDQRVGALSGGQKKCASLASEILNRPNLLLLDEVTSGLDESTDWQIMRQLRRLADEGVTIVVVTHTLANVPEFCDKVICMGHGGQLTFVGTPPPRCWTSSRCTDWERCLTAPTSLVPSAGAPGSKQHLAPQSICQPPLNLTATVGTQRCSTGAIRRSSPCCVSCAKRPFYCIGIRFCCCPIVARW
jgi:ABC-type multidrug transport system ATPase subunit